MPRMCRFVWLIPLLVLSGMTSVCRSDEPAFRELLAKIRPMSPAQALAAFQVQSGFRVELVVAEPMVQDPIAIDWGPDGRLWVVEMGGYPSGGDTTGSGDSSGAPGSGQVRYLEDVDGDGQYDRSTVFLDGLKFPTGVMAWRRGVLVTCAPDIFYAEDTDGDGKADRREVLYRGFVEGNPQHRVNGLRWGLDNWIYAANGDSGGLISAVATDKQVDIHGRDLRIRPDSGDLQAATGMSQFGRCRDDWGNWFGGRNLEPIWHFVLPDHYLRRNAYLVPPCPRADLMNPPTCAPVYPISTPLPRFNELWTQNRFTAACGLAIYRDTQFGPEFEHACFICEPAYNLVYRGTLTQHGVTFQCRRSDAEDHAEFLASRDHWFRPTQVRTGPDGALWVVDMYRQIIEHPDYIPKQWHDQLDFDAGCDKGRVYRVVRVGQSSRPFRTLDNLDTRQLVKEMESPNGIRRDMVQQLLIHRNEPDATGPLEKLTTDADSPAVRLSALCTLDGMQSVPTEVLQAALRDSNPAVRANAVRISEPRLATSRALQAAVLRLAKDPAAPVRMQLAFSLGAWPDRRAAAALADIVACDAQDPFIVAAVASSATPYPGPLLESILGRSAAAPPVAVVRNLMRLCLESSNDDALAKGLAIILAPQTGQFRAWQYELFADLADALQTHGQSLEDFGVSGSASLRRMVKPATVMLQRAAQAAFSDETPLAARVQAVRLVGRWSDPERGRHLKQQLTQLILPQYPLVLQHAAVAQLALLAPENLPALVLTVWDQAGPEIRPQILDALLSRKDWTFQLLDAIAAGNVQAQEIGAVDRNKLLLSGSSDIALRATELFGAQSPKEISDAIRRYRQQVPQLGSAERGRQVFVKHCATCHQLEGEGTDIGADLLALTDRSTETLLVALLDPNQSVEPRFVEYTALTSRGRIISGIITAETGNGITLVNSQGVQHVLVRSDIDELTGTGRSFMPEGINKLFERDTDLRDVITYLQSLPAMPPEPVSGRTP